jgi:hypothetical protein
MPFVVTPITSDIADAILDWCGVASPTPAQVSVAQLAANNAIDTIRHYRRSDIAEAWAVDTAYGVGDVVRPTHANEHLYRCTTAGTSDDDTEPAWPTTSGETVTDGTTIVWTEYERPFEEKYTSLAIEMGVYLWQKRGVDGAVSFGENGVQRSFEKGSFPPSMLARIPLPADAG